MDPANEPLRKCPVDNTEMKKQLVGDVFIIDGCPTCGGVWLDKGELEIIEKKAKDEGWRKGTALGFVFGFPIIFS
jgi:Zn-finger nucleic acid-binding protein